MWLPLFEGSLDAITFEPMNILSSPSTLNVPLLRSNVPVGRNSPRENAMGE